MKNTSLRCKLFSMAVLAMSCILLHAEPIDVTSPNGKIAVSLNADKNISYSVSLNGQKLYDVSNIGININGKNLGSKAIVSKTKTEKKTETIRPVVPLKFSTINSAYTQLSVTFKNGLHLELRVFNNAVAYRLATSEKGNVTVNDEPMTLNFNGNMACHIQQPRSFNTSYEEEYHNKTLEQWKKDGGLATLPALLSADNGTQVLIGETDVDDYPRQFLEASADGIKGTYPKAVAKWEPWGDRGEKVTDADYIARTIGKRTYPWRWQVITDSKGLIEQTIPVQLARQNTLKDVSWIKPGQVSWEWWNGATPYGPDVDFRAGNNYETYKYFIDFAARYGVKYILLDEGWAKSTTDPYTEKPGMRLKDLINYGKQKSVGIVLWLPWLTVEQQIDSVFKVYARWGIPAVKIDFMDHSDQWMVDYYKRVITEAAKNKIMIDFHGAFTPDGLEQEYPNLLSYEGVRGMEQMGGCRPDNSLYLPFIRNAVGPMDFTPGAMNNYQPEAYRCDRPNSGAMGTRAFQMALYVVFESGFQMLADNPTLYYHNDDCTRFITSVPTTWDETRCLAAEPGKYVVVAKRKGDKWFVGGICNGEGSRSFTLSLDFLSHGRTYKLKAYKDGVNADRQAMDYRIEQKSVTSSDSVHIDLVKNGGWAAEIF